MPAVSKAQAEQWLYDAIAHAAFRPKGKLLLTSWVVMAEWIDEQGNRCITRTRSEATTPWQAYGMLSYGLESEPLVSEED